MHGRLELTCETLPYHNEVLLPLAELVPNLLSTWANVEERYNWTPLYSESGCDEAQTRYHAIRSQDGLTTRPRLPVKLETKFIQFDKVLSLPCN